MKHTKGKWHLCKRPDKKCYEILSENGILLAEIDYNTVWSKFEIEAKPNATLIVSAPELLEALIELTKCDYTSGTHLSCAILKAKQAIEKATK